MPPKDTDGKYRLILENNQLSLIARINCRTLAVDTPCTAAGPAIFHAGFLKRGLQASHNDYRQKIGVHTIERRHPLGGVEEPASVEVQKVSPAVPVRLALMIGVDVHPRLVRLRPRRAIVHT